MLGHELARLAEAVRQFTVEVRGAAGVVWREDGVILTNAHVARQDAMPVRLADGREFQAEVAARDARRDLALLRVPASGLTAAVAGDSGSLRPGEFVMAAGSPLGYPRAVATGVVQAGHARDWVRADVRLAPGNSGGPLVDAHGRVVGINAMIVSGLALAVPAEAAERFLALAEGAQPRLGVELRAVREGLLVLHVTPGENGHRAGLRVGDVLVRAGAGTLADQLRIAGFGARIDLDVMRGGVTIQIGVVLHRAEGAAAA
ncbi:MAG: trypsin-like peptidase domain-containing protein [Bryobacterales bacterium]|nr:trypsin-like peptidase domain-containing protein [Bryobacterales bacterium]